MSYSKNYLSENHCRVCGLDQEEPIWGEDGKTPTFHLCCCCGIEFGYEDAGYDGINDTSYLEHIRSIRSYWIEKKGAKWIIPRCQPENWNLQEQLKQIPEEFL